MKNLVATFALVSMATPVFAQSLSSETDSCAMVYDKFNTTQANLTIACDGELILAHTVRTEDKVVDALAFRSELFKAFQTMVNEDGLKECAQYDYPNVWWASCYRKK